MSKEQVDQLWKRYQVLEQEIIRLRAEDATVVQQCNNLNPTLNSLNSSVSILSNETAQLQRKLQQEQTLNTKISTEALKEVAFVNTITALLDQYSEYIPPTQTCLVEETNLNSSLLLIEEDSALTALIGNLNL